MFAEFSTHYKRFAERSILLCAFLKDLVFNNGTEIHFVRAGMGCSESGPDSFPISRNVRPKLEGAIIHRQFVGINIPGAKRDARRGIAR